MYDYVCPVCGAHLDPGENCDCAAEREIQEMECRERIKAVSELLEIEDDGQFRMAV